MVEKIHGTARAYQSATGSLQYYTVWAESPLAFSDPNNATGINILVTGDLSDESQKNFELLVQSVGLRTMPIIMGNPRAVSNLTNEGASVVTGEGFVWKFATEQRDTFKKDNNDVGLLIEELNGIVLANGTVLETSGGSQNIEFDRIDELV